MRKPRKPRSSTFEPATFLNIDIDVRSRRSLASLAAAVPWAGQPLQDSHWLVWSAHASAPTADATARVLVRQINAPPPAARRAWDLATTRTFDIGVRGGMGPRAFEEVTLTHKTLALIAAIRARIQMTVYPPERG
jgi:hypothetical protein